MTETEQAIEVVTRALLVELKGATSTWHDERTKRAADIVAQIAPLLTAALPTPTALPASPEVKPLDQWGVRELARATGISPTTVTRVKRGEGDFDGDTMRAVLAATGKCMCCGVTSPGVQALVEAAKAVEQWDAARGYPIPYRVRDPFRAAIAPFTGAKP
jgi:transcriptional regulator with XRE-family HTH domain